MKQTVLLTVLTGLLCTSALQGNPADKWRQAFDAVEGGDDSAAVEAAKQAASDDEKVDWGIALDAEGPYTELTWLQPARDLAMVLQEQQASAEPSDAADLLVARLELGRDVGHNPASLVIALVSTQVVSAAHADAGETLAKLEKADLLRVAEAAKPYAETTLAAAMKGERAFMYEWLDQQEEFPAEFFAMLSRQETDVYKRSREGRNEARRWQQEAVRKEQLDGLKSAYDEVILAAAIEDAERRFNALQVWTQKVGAGDFGAIARDLLPSIDRASEAMLRRDVALAQVRTAAKLLADPGALPELDPSTGKPLRVNQNGRQLVVTSETFTGDNAIELRIER